LFSSYYESSPTSKQKDPITVNASGTEIKPGERELRQVGKEPGQRELKERTKTTHQ